ncbi:hypothetical protein Lal_00012706 [Lupinus albus]|nr:hypothetical protein Lal_00012706 [Lupinus albus]
MEQMATSLNTLQSQNSDKLPSQTVLNPMNVSAITLRSGKQTDMPTPTTDFVLQKEHDVDASKRNKYVLEENENTTRETHANQPSSILNIDFDFPCTSLYTCYACTDSELCDSCIDEFLNIVVDSPVTHLHCTNTIDVGIIQQSDLFFQVQAATKPSFATLFPSILHAPDWIPPFDIECNIAVYDLGTILSSYEFDFLPP